MIVATLNDDVPLVYTSQNEIQPMLTRIGSVPVKISFLYASTPDQMGSSRFCPVLSHLALMREVMNKYGIEKEDWLVEGNDGKTGIRWYRCGSPRVYVRKMFA